MDLADQLSMSEALEQVLAYRADHEAVATGYCLVFATWHLWVWCSEDYDLRLGTHRPPHLTTAEGLDVTHLQPWTWARGRAIVWAWEMVRFDDRRSEGLILEFEHLADPIDDPLHRTGQVQLMALGGLRVRRILATD